ncbi:MAG: PepSY-associated TM helix domain-containing protein [Pseudomonadota bacterium]
MSLRRALFQVHLWTGLVTGVYILVICLSGSAIVFRREMDHAICQRNGFTCEPAFVTWLARFHGELLAGKAGLRWNGVGAVAVALICLTGAILWWPGKSGWWRRMSVRTAASGSRFVWELHHTLGFWAFLIIFVWALTGIYFAFPDVFMGDGETKGSLFLQDVVATLTRLHFGRAYGMLVKVLWTVLGLVPCTLFVTGVMMWLNRRSRRVSTGG